MMRSIICAAGGAPGAKRRRGAATLAHFVRCGRLMIPELGHFALILALAVALVQGTLPLLGAARGDGRLMALGQHRGPDAGACS